MDSLPTSVISARTWADINTKYTRARTVRVAILQCWHSWPDWRMRIYKCTLRSELPTCLPKYVSLFCGFFLFFLLLRSGENKRYGLGIPGADVSWHRVNCPTYPQGDRDMWVKLIFSHYCARIDAAPTQAQKGFRNVRNATRFEYFAAWETQPPANDIYFVPTA